VELYVFLGTFPDNNKEQRSQRSLIDGSMNLRIRDYLEEGNERTLAFLENVMQSSSTTAAQER